MNKIQRLSDRFLLSLIFLATVAIVNGQPQRFSFTRNKMASPFTIILYAPDSTTAASVADRCYRRVDELVEKFSDYIDSSELNRLCAVSGSAIPFDCSDELWEILSISRQAWLESGGTFDITLGPLTRLWRKARKAKEFPPDSLVQQMKKRSGGQYLLLNQSQHAAVLVKKNMQLDLGGIAQGYIGREVLKLITSTGISRALVDVSGDIVCSDPPPGKNGWTIAINAPESEEKTIPRQLLLSNTAVTTSGDVYQYFEYNGKRYSHIVDPSTGYGITSQRNVTVVAKDAVLADWLTKACSILPVRKAKRLAENLNASVLIAVRTNDRIRFYPSKSWRFSPGF